MMVETMLESSQDFGMPNGALPQWKREVLQRRAARSRTSAAPPPPPPPAPAPAPPDEDEELRYGPGIVKRLQSRYLSLALRDAPRRRPSVLRRAASLEQLLDERPPPAPRPHPLPHPRPARPLSMAAPQAALNARRDSVKRARSVDALSRLDALDHPRPPPASPPTPPPQPPRPPPFQARSARTPRRPAPLLREAERPPPDVVRSALRKFESAPLRRAAPSARVSAVLRGLEGPRTSTPEPRELNDGPLLSPCPASPLPAPAAVSDFVTDFQSVTVPVVPAIAAPVTVDPPSPTAPPTAPPTLPSTAPPTLPSTAPPTSPPTAPPTSPPTAPPTSPPTAPSTSPPSALHDGPSGPSDEVGPPPVGPRPVSRAALDGIARAGSTVRYAFEAPRAASHLPPLAATNAVLLGRARRVGVIRPMPARTPDAGAEPPAEEGVEKSPDRLTSPPPPPESEPSPPSRVERREPPPAALVEPTPRAPASPPPGEPPLIIERSPSPKLKSKSNTTSSPLTNGHGGPDRVSELKGALSRIGAAGIERAWSGSAEKPAAPWAEGAGGARRGRVPAPSCTSVVFNFSNRKEVPDYIENNGIVLRGSRRNRIKAGEPGVVVLRPEALVRSDSDSESELDGGGPPSPCAVRFVNDNVLINGKSSMIAKPNKDRIAKLKLQFDDSLTRTFEYPSEVSLCEDSPSPAPAPAQEPAPTPAHSTLAANTHMSSAALSRYTPSKTVADDFQLGVTRHEPAPSPQPADTQQAEAEAAAEACAELESACGAEAARAWSEARSGTTDLLF